MKKTEREAARRSEARKAEVRRDRGPRRRQLM
jgi:hypothetical protein